MTLFLIVVYFLLVSFYEGGNFTISLDPDFAQKSGLVIYENNSEDDKRILKATSADFIDNISVKWLPKDIHQRGGGSLNGENYFAYSFYIENKGSNVVNYWYEIVIDDVIKNADEAVRVMIYRNDDMKANNANTLYTFVEMTKFTKSEFDRAITFIFYGVQFSWNVKFVQIRKKLNSSYLGYTITRSSNSFIHKHVQSDIMLKYDTCLIPVSFDSEITVSQLVQEACIVSL